MNDIGTLKGKERGETTEYVYNLLKEMIFEWRLPPGKKINISHLAQEIDVSTIPLREALSRLNSDKLVAFEPNKGYRVSDILDADQMVAMLDVRVLLEIHAIKSLIRLNKIRITEAMIQINEMMSSMKIGSSYKEVLNFVNLDQKFHYCMFIAVGNDFLNEAYKGMHCHLHIARFYHVRGEVDQKEAALEHMEIIEAIRTRDIYRAEIAVTKHIHDAKSRLFTK